MLYFPYYFNFIPLLREWIKEHVDPLQQSFALSESDIRNIKKIVDDETRAKGMPPLEHVHLFNRPEHSSLEIHLDAYPDAKDKKVTYNIPVTGINSTTVFQWFTGDYKKNMVFFENAAGKKVPYYKLVWESEPKLADTILFDRPYFLNIEHPHRVITGPEKRLTIGLRFKGQHDINHFKNILCREKDG